MRTPEARRSIFQPRETGYYIRAPKIEQNAIKIFACPTGK
jgi:hypothetical protein